MWFFYRLTVTVNDGASCSVVAENQTEASQCVS